MTNLIKSDTQTALSAVSGFVGLNTTSWQEEQVTFSYTSGISGMANGLQTANQLIQAVSQFGQAVVIQAEKLPEIAAEFERRDAEEAMVWENWLWKIRAKKNVQLYCKRLLGLSSWKMMCER